MAKGGAYERMVSVQLSLWWSQYEDEPREDLFWRCSGSGARATVRGRMGKRTTGHTGDIHSTDPISLPFSRVFATEAKRGYGKATIHSILDRSAKAKKQEYEEWIEQAESSMRNSGAYAWMLIHKRDYREPMMFMPLYAADKIDELEPVITIQTPGVSIVGYVFEEWLSETDPESIIEVANSLK